jgi:drug/metabolite transporter (DMT)-like permease
MLGLSGFFWFFLSDLCLLKAYVMIGPRLSLLVMSLGPPMAATLSWICLGDRLVAWRWAAMAVTLCGVAWVVSEQPERTSDTEAHRQRGKGFLFALSAAVLQAVAIVLSKGGTSGCDAMAATVIAMLGALLGHVLLITFWRRWPAMFVAARQGQVLLVMTCAALIGPFLGVVLSMIALQHAPAGVVATIIATMPILVLPFSVFLHRETISSRAVVGALIAITGVALLSVPC